MPQPVVPRLTPAAGVAGPGGRSLVFRVCFVGGTPKDGGAGSLKHLNPQASRF